MARRPVISPSRLTTFLACPVKYRWTHVDPRGKWYMKARSYYSFGTTLHKALERFHDSSDTGVTTVAEAVAAVEESWIDSGYGSAEEMAEALGDGKALIERYVEESQAAAPKGNCLFVEKTLSMEFDRFRLVGRLDRVDELADGSLEIVDYKSGFFDFTPEDASSDIALSCYQLLLKQSYPDRRVTATLLSLRSGASASYSLSPVELDVFAGDVEYLGNQILNTEFQDLAPTPKPLCRHCDFLRLCLKHPDFEFELAEDAE